MNFLPAGIINDTVADIHAKAIELQELMASHDLYHLKQGLREMEDMALELAVFLQTLSCQPLIYTGSGSTEEVIRRLEWALTFSEEIDPVEYYRYKEKFK
ncbi:MAG: hypothetical protein PHD40_07500 [Syntrophomonadaceae bacterium]|nr:hypothetical protein [Syntrophomonadaceae bacterium]